MKIKYLIGKQCLPLIAFRDIKPENFLLKHKDDISNIKMIDFGLSKDYSEKGVMQTPSGSVIYSPNLKQPYYIAPEVFQQNYNSKCDLWSMGVVLYIILSGKVPFPGDSNKEIIENVIAGEFHFNHDGFKGASADVKDLITKLLVKDVDKRYSANEAYSHPWIQNIKDQIDREIAGDAISNMKNFIGAARFKKAALTYLASKLPENCIDDLRSAFI